MGNRTNIQLYRIYNRLNVIQSLETKNYTYDKPMELYWHMMSGKSLRQDNGKDGQYQKIIKIICSGLGIESNGRK